MIRKFEVIEDNAGGLHLAIFNENDTVIYMHSGYEYVKGQLQEDIEALQDKNNPVEDWDGNCGGLEWEYGKDPQALYDEIVSCEYGWSIVADNNGIYPKKMGCAARMEFGILEEE